MTEKILEKSWNSIWIKMDSMMMIHYCSKVDLFVCLFIYLFIIYYEVCIVYQKWQ